MSTPSYDWWRSALRGEVGLIHEPDPQPGFYRKKAGKQGGWIPVAIWHDGSGMVALAGKKMVDANDIWTWVCRNPVQEAHYRQALSGGKWHDEIDEPAAGIGHNLPTDPVERFKLMIEMEREAIEAFLKVPIAAEDDAVKAGRWSGKLKDIAKEIDEKRVELKKPHDPAVCRVVNSAFLSLGPSFMIKFTSPPNCGPYCRLAAPRVISIRSTASDEGL
jgi:hypothetical protein